MSKHTPPPWVIKFRNDHSAYISMGNPSSEHKQFDIEFDDRYPSDVADARLIAAAPDLLERLKDAAAVMRANGLEISAVYAEEAIARATREQQ